MELNVAHWPLYSVDKRKPSIDPQPDYQRGPVWSVANQQLLIDSILRGYDIPKLYLRRRGKSPYDWEVIDGQQRLRAVWNFMSNIFPLSGDLDPVGGHNVAGLLFENLPYEVNDQFMAYTLTVVEIANAKNEEVEDMFLRLQNGIPLNAAEKRNAISGPVRDFVRQTAKASRLMRVSVPFKDLRYSHDELVAQMLLVELRGGPTSVRHTQLSELYRSKSFRKASPHTGQLKKVMNFLHRAFPKQSPELTKVNLLSLYTLASEALLKYALRKRAQEFGRWFVEFEKRRRLDESKPEDERDEKMVSYQIAVLQQTASLASQQERQRILAQDMEANLPNLILLDKQRQFTSEQRAEIFRRTDGKCVNPGNRSDCEVDCKWDNFHADHIVPHSDGGPTTVDNGQLLCPKCNRRKAASNPAK